jgi:hypothetical protein
VSARHLGLVLDWRAAVCGAVLGEGDKLPTTNEDAVECKDCLKIIAERGVGPSTPQLHTPPNMDDNEDGVFTFYDAVEGSDWYMQVVPMPVGGNVEFTVGEQLFTLSHLDRADLIRALLHDFHYSPERGGPADD